MTSPDRAIIACEGVDKSFPTEHKLVSWIRHRGAPPRHKVLDGISLRVQPGEFFGLLGPNGAGKTTLLKLIATLSLPDRGRIVVNGADAVSRPNAVKREIGLCTSEDRSFYYRLTARHNLQFFGTLAGLRGRALASRISEVVEFVDLGQALDRRFATFSTGMRQRLSIARALLADPDILLLDEPTRGVDPVHADALRRLLRNELVLGRGKTVVLTTNILEEAWAVCDRLAILNVGRVVAMGSPAELNARIGARVRYAITCDRIGADLLSRVQLLAGVASAGVAGVNNETLTVELSTGGRTLTDLLSAVSENGTIVRAVRPLDDSLLELFRATTRPSDA